MAKWERGSKVREEGQQVVWWRINEHKKNETGQVHKMNKWLISERGGAGEEKLWPCTHRSRIDCSGYPTDNPVQAWVRGLH